MPPERRLDHGIGQRLFDEMVGAGGAEGLMPKEFLSVDGALIETEAGFRIFRSRYTAEAEPGWDEDPGNLMAGFTGRILAGGG